MKRVRIGLKGLERVDCPNCCAPCWLHGSLGWVHRVPLCRWFANRLPSRRVRAAEATP